jgi:Flp pilus assembly protein TadG
MVSSSSSAVAPSGPLGRVRHVALRFRRSDDGATAVEFALIAVPFIGLLFAIFETALVFFANEGLEAAVAEAARGIMTGQVQGNSSITSAATFRDQLICNPPGARILPSFINCSSLLVDVRPATVNGATSFSAADTTKDFYTASQQKFCTGGPDDVVIVRVAYPMPVYFSTITSTGIVANGRITAGLTAYNGSLVHMIMGVAAFRNEPFPNYAGPASGC